MADVFDQRLVTEAEKPLLCRLRQAIGDDLLKMVPPETRSDLGLLRFLRFSNLNVDATVKSFRRAVEWRSARNANQWRDKLIMQKTPEQASVDEIVKHYTDMTRLPHWGKVGAIYPERMFHGCDKHGNPIQLTTCDMISQPLALITLMTRKEYDECRIARLVNMELYLDALSRKLGRLVKHTILFDLAGANMATYKLITSKPVQAMLDDWFNHAANSFPEQTYRFVAVNTAPWLLLLWKAIRVLIPMRSLRKVCIVGTSDIAETLVKRCDIPPTALPKTMGGSCEFTGKYVERPTDTVAAVRTERLEIRGGESVALDLRATSQSYGCELYWSLYVHGGKDVEVQWRDGNNAKTVKVSDFFKHSVLEDDCACEEFKSSQKIVVVNPGNKYFSKVVDFVVVEVKDEASYHEVSSVPQDNITIC